MEQPINGFARASAHMIVHPTPAVDFFAGALLGNGGLGAVVTTRPDAIVIHFGHNNVWDIRVAEDHADAIEPFQPITIGSIRIHGSANTPPVWPKIMPAHTHGRFHAAR
ncbi:MAG TPA: hypothetical protein PKC19_04430 [Roseiflexaceae bacterium]|nr:hypothetical protein [Roseiflexaceae bacterium]